MIDCTEAYEAIEGAWEIRHRITNYAKSANKDESLKKSGMEFPRQ